MADSARSTSPSPTVASSKKRKASPAAEPPPNNEPAIESAPQLKGGEEALPLPSEDAPPLPNEEAPALPDEDAPPLPSENAPPLPTEAPPPDATPAEDEDDGWQPVWDPTHQAYYFYNSITQATQWDNPRVPVEATTATSLAPGTSSANAALGAPPTSSSGNEEVHPAVAGGYNPAIHGSYDPNADYAQLYTAPDASSSDAAFPSSDALQPPGTSSSEEYLATGTFNRFTGRFQAPSINSENHNDEAKSRRQMAAFFDVDRAANSHDGRSLKAERSGKKLSKKELKEFQSKRRERKEEKRRAWLRD